MSKTFHTNTRMAPICRIDTSYGPFRYDSLWGNEIDRLIRSGCAVCRGYNDVKFAACVARTTNDVLTETGPLSEYGVLKVSVKADPAPADGTPRDTCLNLGISVRVSDSFIGKAEAALLDVANRDAVVRCASETPGYENAGYDEVWRRLEKDIEAALECIREGKTGDGCEGAFGLILTLLWSLNYEVDDSSITGRWLSDVVLSRMSTWYVGDFCTIINGEDVRERFGKSMVDFPAERESLEKNCEMYSSCHFSDRKMMEEVVSAFRNKVNEKIRELEYSQMRLISDFATKFKKDDKYVKRNLSSFKESVSSEIGSGGYAKMWREAYNEVRGRS